MTTISTSYAKEFGISTAQEDLIDLINDMIRGGWGIDESELDTRQKAALHALVRKGIAVISITGNITLTDKLNEEAKKMATKKAVKGGSVDEKGLKAVAKDLNDVLGLEPAIDLKAKDLLERVREEAQQIGVDPKTGEISEKLVAGDKKELQKETWVFLEEHEMLGHLEVAEEKETGEEAEEEEEEKPVAKKAGKKAPVEKAEKPAKKEKVEKALKEKKISSRTIVADLVQEGKHTCDEIIKLASKKNVPVPHIKMYLKAWEKKDRVPYNMEVLHTTKEGVLKFK